MKIVLNIIFALIIALIGVLSAGQYGGFIIFAIMLGILLTMYQRQSEIQNDIQKIKEHLGIKEINEFDMHNEDIEKELVKDLENDEDNNDTRLY